MEPIRSLPAQVFLNNQSPNKTNNIGIKQGQHSVVADLETPHDVVKKGNIETMSNADDLLSRGNAYADASAKIQKNLDAYHEVASAAKRETLSQLMGVDIYA